MYSSYPSFFRSFFGINLNAWELMQYLLDPFGPSLNSCPRCEFAFLLLISVLTIAWEKSLCLIIASSLIGFENAGHPHPESNLSFEVKRTSPSTTSTYIPTFHY